MENPYKILGVTPSATDVEIKKAYRELAKKYHPDNYVNNPLADLASEKMKQINEAYDAIMKERSNPNFSGSTEDTSSKCTPEEARIRVLINEGRISEAEIMLGKILPQNRGAEWHFLMGCVCVRRGWLFDARNHAETATRLDPTNQEYIALFRTVSGSTRHTGPAECTICDLCTAFMCMDCLCDCCR